MYCLDTLSLLFICIYIIYNIYIYYIYIYMIVVSTSWLKCLSNCCCLAYSKPLGMSGKCAKCKTWQKDGSDTWCLGCSAWESIGRTSPCLSASHIKQSAQAYEDLRCALVGDCFSVYSFVIFPWAALRERLPDFDYHHLCQRMGMAPGFSAPFWLHCPLQRRLCYGSPQSLGPTIGDLTRVLLTRVNHTGSDVRVTTGQVMAPKAFPRQSAAPQWWEWKHVFHSRWKAKEHINLLEMRAIMLALRWRVCHLKEIDVRFCHLTDSYVCMSVLSKGRSSSDMLMVVLRKVAAFCLCFGLLPILLHVESTENPTDEASRA